MKTGIVTIACVLALAGCVVSESSADDTEQIKATALNYLEGFFTSDPVRMAEALHPNLFKCTVKKFPDSEDEILQTMTAEELIAVCRINQSWVEGSTGVKSLDILHQDSRIAVVHAVSDGFYDLINLMKLNGEWKIVQVLWDRN